MYTVCAVSIGAECAGGVDNAGSVVLVAAAGVAIGGIGVEGAGGLDEAGGIAVIAVAAGDGARGVCDKWSEVAGGSQSRPGPRAGKGHLYIANRRAGPHPCWLSPVRTVAGSGNGHHAKCSDNYLRGVECHIAQRLNEAAARNKLTQSTVTTGLKNVETIVRALAPCASITQGSLHIAAWEAHRVSQFRIPSACVHHWGTCMHMGTNWSRCYPRASTAAVSCRAACLRFRYFRVARRS